MANQAKKPSDATQDDKGDAKQHGETVRPMMTEANEDTPEDGEPDIVQGEEVFKKLVELKMQELSKAEQAIADGEDNAYFWQDMAVEGDDKEGSIRAKFLRQELERILDALGVENFLKHNAVLYMQVALAVATEKHDARKLFSNLLHHAMTAYSYPETRQHATECIARLELMSDFALTGKDPTGIVTGEADGTPHNTTVH